MPGVAVEQAEGDLVECDLDGGGYARRCIGRRRPALDAADLNFKAAEPVEELVLSLPRPCRPTRRRGNDHSPPGARGDPPPGRPDRGHLGQVSDSRLRPDQIPGLLASLYGLDAVHRLQLMHEDEEFVSLGCPRIRSRDGRAGHTIGPVTPPLVEGRGKCIKA